MKLSASTIDHLMSNWPIARLATVRLDGKPHLIPLVFAYSAGLLWSPVDGKPKRDGELARIVNAEVSPNASLLLDYYTDDWTQLWWLRIDVRLTVIRLDEATPSHAKTVTAAVEALRAKYSQYQRVPLLRDPPTLLSMRPQKTNSWCASNDGYPR